MSESYEEKTKNYAEIRRRYAELYASFGFVRCPALGNNTVHFTSEGFNHLVYASKREERDRRVQIMRFKLLLRAKTIIELSTTFQEYEESCKEVPVNRRGKTVHQNVLICSWGFIAIVKHMRVKVVVRQVGNGKKEFYSVIPAWVTRNYRGIKLIETSVGSGLTSNDDNEILKNAVQIRDDVL